MCVRVCGGDFKFANEAYMASGNRLIPTPNPSRVCLECAHCLAARENPAVPAVCFSDVTQLV